jgi:KaiC/GvpD/RAD55 family RecA-like ATPase
MESGWKIHEEKKLKRKLKRKSKKPIVVMKKKQQTKTTQSLHLHHLGTLTIDFDTTPNLNVKGCYLKIKKLKKKINTTQLKTLLIVRQNKN